MHLSPQTSWLEPFTHKLQLPPTLHIHSGVRIACCTLVLVLLTLEVPCLHLHPPSLSIFQVLFLPGAFLSTTPHHDSSHATQLLHSSFNWHSTPQLKLSWYPTLPWYSNLTLFIPLLPLLVSLCWESVFGPLLSSLSSLSLMPHTISQLLLFPLHSRIPNLDLQNSVLSPQFLSQISNYQWNIGSWKWALLPSPFSPNEALTSQVLLSPFSPVTQGGKCSH